MRTVTEFVTNAEGFSIAEPFCVALVKLLRGGNNQWLNYARGLIYTGKPPSSVRCFKTVMNEFG